MMYRRILRILVVSCSAWSWHWARASNVYPQYEAGIEASVVRAEVYCCPLASLRVGIGYKAYHYLLGDEKPDCLTHDDQYKKWVESLTTHRIHTGYLSVSYGFNLKAAWQAGPQVMVRMGPNLFDIVIGARLTWRVAQHLYLGATSGIVLPVRKRPMENQPWSSESGSYSFLSLHVGIPLYVLRSQED